MDKDETSREFFRKMPSKLFTIRESLPEKRRALFKHQKNSLDYIKNMLISEKYSWIIAAVLFGSCARLDNDYTSDVDVLLIIDKQSSHEEIMNLKSSLAALDENEYAEIDVKFFTLQYFYQGKSEFLNAVRKEGKIIWTRIPTLTLQKMTTNS